MAMLRYLNHDMTIQIMEKGLDASALRQRIISNNIANVDTPGFKRSRVEFEEHLEKALRHRAIDLANVRPRIRQVTTEMKDDGNNVDIDYEMSALARNTVMYNAISQSVIEKFRTLSYVLKEVR